MKSIYRPNFFDDDTFEKIKKTVLEKINNEEDVRYGQEFKRYYSIIFFTNEVKEILLEKAKKETQDEDLEIIYVQVVKYQINGEAIPELRKHKDSANGEWVMDVVIDATIDWPLIIEGESFSNLPNSVIFIKGEEEEHWRPDFPSGKEEDYVVLLFVHLANKDSHYAKISRQFDGMSEKTLNSFFKIVDPSWGSKTMPKGLNLNIQDIIKRGI
jgi:hypothetical protein